jgi:hypothetical protein
MESSPTPHSSAWPFPFPQQDWAQTPPAVQTYLLAVQQSLTQLQARVEALEARLHQNSTTSHRPPSSDTPYKKPRHRSTSAPAAKRVGNRGMRDTARGCCPRQRCTISDLSGVRVARQPLPRPSHTIRTKSLSCPLSSWRYGTSYCIGGGVRPVAPSPRRTCLPSMRRAMVHGSVRSWASWQGYTGMADAWYKP